MAGVSVTGVLLAAGAGRRAGGPKALRRDPSGIPWVVSSVRTLLDGGCSRVVVVLGSVGTQVREALDGMGRGAAVTALHADGWELGMSVSLRTGLAAVARGPAAGAALVHLVDLPDVGADVVRRVLSRAPAGSWSVLARAGYAGRPGHPVLVGPRHLRAMLDQLDEVGPGAADTGGRAYLAGHDVLLVECGDLASGRDHDFGRGAGTLPA